jgi:hypothetical protein
MSNFQCVLCKHYLGKQRCEAFPEGISSEIFIGETSHYETLPGDHGIHWEPVVKGQQNGQDTGR